MSESESSNTVIVQPEIVSNNRDLGHQFLLADFSALREFKIQCVEISNKRVDTQITLTSALLVGFGILSQMTVDTRTLAMVAVISSVGLLVIGLETFRQVIVRDILISDYIRAINRIRSYYAENAPQIRDYLLMPTVSTYPKYDWKSSIRRLPMMLNSIMTGIGLSITEALIRPKFLLDSTTFTIFVITLMIIYLLQTAYANNEFNNAEEKSKAKQTISLFEANETFRR